MTDDERNRQFWLIIRQAIIMILGAIEVYRLGMPQSITPKHKA